MATNISHRETYQAGATIIREDTPSEAAYLIETGEVAVLKDYEGKKVLVVTLSAGDVFGEMGVLGRLPHTATVRAKTEVRLAIINKRNFLAEFDKMSEQHRALILALITRLRVTTEKLAKLTVQIHQLKAYADTLAERVQPGDTEQTRS
ncbi:MAG: cyclic nucleotide-binding domain-containing protein [Candidatus Tectomicrobia bacterium]|nr:cyclic nucleotide-binding domain-containing protein [Candidatus Tectomicrobia bacterium]